MKTEVFFDDKSKLSKDDKKKGKKLAMETWIDELQGTVYKNDKYKPTCINNPMKFESDIKWLKRIITAGIISDTGLLLYAIDSLKKTKSIKTSQIFFICHTTRQKKFAENLIDMSLKYNIKLDVIFIKYKTLVRYKKSQYNFLKEEHDMKFDLILSNPPYKNELWKYFFLILIDSLKENGFLYSINPQSYRKPNHKILNAVKSYNLISLKMLNRKNSRAIFPDIYQSVDILLLQKCDYQGITKIIDYNDVEYKININKVDFIPNKHLNFIYNKLVEKNITKRIKVYKTNKFSYTKCKVVQDLKYKYPVMNVVHKRGDIHNIIYSSFTDEDLNFPKLILSELVRGNVAFNDNNGKYLISSQSFAFKISSFNSREKYKKIIASKQFKEIYDAITYSNMRIDPKVFGYFKKNFFDIVKELK